MRSIILCIVHLYDYFIIFESRKNNERYQLQNDIHTSSSVTVIVYLEGSIS